MQRRKMPHIVAEEDGRRARLRLCGAVPQAARPIAIRSNTRSMSTTPICIAASAGSLMTALIDACAAAGFRQMIGYIDAANEASLAIHERFGFRRVGYPAADRLQVRALDGFGDGAALARTWRDRGAGFLRRGFRALAQNLLPAEL